MKRSSWRKVSSNQGPPQSTAAPSTVAPTTAAPTTLGPDASALTTLASYLDEDRVFVQSQLLFSWVPQLSAKRVGTTDNGIVYGLPEILSLHDLLRTRYGAKLIQSSEYAFRDADLWISVAPAAFATADGALGWCVAQGIGPDDCFAKKLTTDRTETGTVKYQS